MTTDIQKLITNFVTSIEDAIERLTRERLMSALGAPSTVPTRALKGVDLGSLAKPFLGAMRLAGIKGRRKGPIQLCPAPRCTNRAAPVFGMVCSKHKDLPKATIKKYREARRKRANAAK